MNWQQVSARHSILQELAAHPSTQHANKMFVKVGTMFGRNKSEICAGIFAAASNGFLLLGQDENKADKDIENLSDSLNEDIQGPPNEVEILEDDNNSPKRRKRYYRVNKKKLLRMELVVIKKSNQIAALAGTLGPKEYSIRKENIKQQLTSKDKNLKAQQAKEKEVRCFQKLTRTRQM
jgi:hypothetical protein